MMITAKWSNRCGVVLQSLHRLPLLLLLLHLLLLLQLVLHLLLSQVRARMGAVSNIRFLEEEEEQEEKMMHDEEAHPGWMDLQYTSQRAQDVFRDRAGGVTAVKLCQIIHQSIFFWSVSTKDGLVLLEEQ